LEQAEGDSGPMPIYEYRCRVCAHEFEKLIRTGDVPACPNCGALEPQQLLSMFAVSSESTRQASIKLARKANSKERRDKDMAEWEDFQHHQH
jgi:putative FmdB family regulatory protein